MAVDLALDTGTQRVLVRDGRVASVDADAVIPGGARLLSAPGGAITAGFVNAHTHVYSGLAALGMPRPTRPPRDFVELLRTVWWRLDRALDRASLRASARFAMASSLRLGTTALLDHHESPSLIEGSLEVLAQAAEEVGVRLWTCYGATERNGGRDEAQRGLAECARFAASRPSGKARGMVGLHASFTVSDETLRDAGALARALGVVVHVHLAEAPVDDLDARSRGYASAWERLRRTEALPRGSVIAHGVHLSPDEVAAVEGAGHWIVQNPRSNVGNAVGFARELSRSDRVALGTDGYPSDLRAEREALRSSSEAAGCALAPAVESARCEAASALWSALEGRPYAAVPTVGCVADLVLWASPRDPRTPGARPLAVVVEGEPVLEGGQLVRVDEEALEREARAEAERLWQRMRQRTP